MQFPVELLKTFVVLAKIKNFTAAGKQIHRYPGRRAVRPGSGIGGKTCCAG